VLGEQALHATGIIQHLTTSELPALKPSQSTSFGCYLYKQTVGKVYDPGSDFVAQPTFVVGEADTVEFFISYEETQKAVPLWQEVAGAQAVSYMPCFILQLLAFPAHRKGI
jgi:hypothetical protein